jgi:ATP-dependent 26S proteasome regulatory subunit
MSLQRGINQRSLAEKMGNCSGAEVRGICTEAGQCFSLFSKLRLETLIIPYRYVCST